MGLLNTCISDQLCIFEFSSNKANALEEGILSAFDKELSRAKSDKNINAILIQSSGDKIFSAGADISVYRNKSEVDIASYLYSLASFLSQLLYFPKTVITAAGGLSVGGALGILAASDYVICSDTSSFKLPEFELGVAPSVISPFLQIKIGTGSLKNISFGGETLSAEWGIHCGLVSEVCSQDSFKSRVSEKSAEISTRPYAPVIDYKYSLSPLKEELERKLKEYSIVNAKNIYTANKNGLFEKKPKVS